MYRSTAARALRASCVFGGVLISTLVVAPSAVAQSGGAAPAANEASGTGWSYGARGIVTVLRQESLGTGFGVSGFAVLPLSARLELEGEVAFVTMSSETNGLPAGRLSVVPLRATLRVQVWRFAGADLYAGGGAGVYLTRFSIDEAVERELALVGFGAAASVDPAFVLHATGGLVWHRERLSFGVDVKYVVGEADAPSEVIDLVSGDRFTENSKLDLNGLWIAAGASFRF